MKEFYKEPVIEIIKFNTEDVISTSGGEMETPGSEIVDPPSID